MFGVTAWLLLWLFGVVVVGVSAFCETRSLIDNPDLNTGYGTPDPATSLVLWVTSVSSTGGQWHDLAGLDAMCTATQPQGTINGFTHVDQPRVAFISDSSVNAKDRTLNPEFDIINSKGDCLAATISDLLAGHDYSYLLLDEKGDRLPQSSDQNYVYSGTSVKGLSDGTSYCSDWTSSSSSLTSSAGFLPTVAGSTQGPAKWLNFPDSSFPCDTPLHFYCISLTAPPTSTTPAPTSDPDAGGAGDPQFVGLQGQTFQVHGIPDEYFNLLSHPFTQLNSHFTYLATGTCHYNDTLCWSHPGTYVDELGVMLPGVHVGVRAGTHAQGLTVTINGKVMRVPGLHAHLESVQTPTQTRSSKGQAAFTATFPIQLDNETIASPHNAWLEPPEDLDMSGSSSSSSSSAHSDSASASASAPWYSWLSSATVRVSFHSHNRVVIHTPVATIDIYNAEHFFNFQLELRAPRLLLAGARVHRVLGSQSQSQSHSQSPHPSFPMHGIVGQTWKNVRYPNGRLYSGQVDDYMLTDRTLFSTQFHFNEYLY